MKRLFATVVLLSIPALTGCPAKDSQSSSGAASPSSAAAAIVTGPLAKLESAPFANEMWTAQEGGAPAPFIFYTQQNVRLSAQCRSAGGELTCDAIKQMRGTPVEVSKKDLTGNISAGTRACMKLGNQLWSAHNAAGAEDGFCKFKDGSLVSTGALEQYGMKIVD